MVPDIQHLVRIIIHQSVWVVLVVVVESLVGNWLWFLHDRFLNVT